MLQSVGSQRIGHDLATEQQRRVLVGVGTGIAEWTVAATGCWVYFSEGENVLQLDRRYSSTALRI